MIDGRVSPAQVTAADVAGPAQTVSGIEAGAEQPAAGANDAEYSVDFGEGDQRTMSVPAIVEAYNNGVVTAETYVWTDGMPDWAQLGDVPELVDALHAAAQGPASELQSGDMASPASGASSPWSGRTASAAERAATAGSAGAATDLFGGYASAGSEEDVTTSLPQETPAPAGAHTGARNESSVLFSLSALTASAGSSPPSAAAPSSTFSAAPGRGRDAEDSGLIDLAALTAGGATKLGAPTNPDDSGMLGAPLTIAAPLGAPAPPPVAAAPLDLGPLEYPKGPSKGPYVIGGSIVIAALVVAAVFLLKPEPEPVVTQPAIITQPAPVPTPEPEPQPAATATSTAAPPSTGVAEEGEPDAGADKKVVRRTAPRSSPRSTRSSGSTKASSGTSSKSSGSSSQSSSGSSAPAAKPATKCGCPPGDLKCAMRCAATGG